MATSKHFTACDRQCVEILYSKLMQARSSCESLAYMQFKCLPLRLAHPHVEILKEKTDWRVSRDPDQASAACCKLLDEELQFLGFSAYNSYAHTIVFGAIDDRATAAAFSAVCVRISPFSARVVRSTAFDTSRIYVIV